MNPWVILGLIIAALDAWLIKTRRDTLSAHFHRTSIKYPLPLAVGVTYLLSHLYGALPVRVDAFKAFGWAMDRPRV